MKNILIILLSLYTMAASAQITPRWLRQSAISPDGKTVAFCYQGDIYTVSSEGGQAVQLTMSEKYDSNPIWTPDGTKIIFASFREDSKDIWAVDAKGGTPVRLTTYSGAENPLCVDNANVYFASNIQVDPLYSEFPGDPQLYKVALSGGKVSRLTSMPVGAASINAAGTILYEDIKGVEDPLRKHHTSAVTRDIWKFVPSIAEYVKLTTFKGENRNPVFASDGVNYYFLAENGGSFNVYKGSLETPGEFKQLTFLQTHPVRGLSVSNDGKMLFSFNGDLYTCVEGSQPVKLEVTLFRDSMHPDKTLRNINSEATCINISPNGNELAVISHGDVFVTSIDYMTARRITNTPVQERDLCFAPDGRTLYYSSERDGEWGIWKTSLNSSKDELFTYAFDFKEERFTPAGQTCFQPAVSPDGKWVAYLRDRTDLVIRSVNGSKEKELLCGVNYSYVDGDLIFAWSPDSKYILSTYMGEGGWNNEDVALIDVCKGTVTNLTASGYSDTNFAWGMNGAALTWTSDKAGYRSHGSWGADNDIYAMFLDPSAWAKFSLDKEGRDIAKGFNKKAKEKKDSTVTDKDNKNNYILENCEDRVVRLTRTSGKIGGQFLSSDGDYLYYVQDDKLYKYDVLSKNNKVLCQNAKGNFDIDKDGKNIYMFEGGKVCKIELSSGKKSSITFTAEYEYYPAKEREYIFNHCWKQVKEKFYDPGMHGVDWEFMRDNYAAFLPYIDNNFDFKDLLSEMLGELNASHTGARYSYPVVNKTGRLGVLWDENYEGKGLKIAEILPKSVLLTACPEIKAGDVITSIDGVEIPAGAQWFDIFDKKAGKRLCISVKGRNEPVYVKPGNNDSESLYKRWVRRNEEYVSKQTGGRVGYVHIKSMNSDSFRELYSKALGKWRGCEALIVDTRHNGGGWLHDDVATFLGGREYARFEPRGQYIGSDPYNKWRKPSCIVMSEDNYSDACGTPYVYRTLGLGKLIGAPVAGTMTSVWWETQVDGTLIFGIPQVGKIGLAEGCYMENHQLEPDILVYNDPASVTSGKDPQLDAAIAEMLKEIEKNE